MTFAAAIADLRAHQESGGRVLRLVAPRHRRSGEGSLGGGEPQSTPWSASATARRLDALETRRVALRKFWSEVRNLQI